MRRSDLGEFEEVVLLAVVVLSAEAYSVAIARELELEIGYVVSVGAVHAALQRLVRKGYLTSIFSEAVPERGGRRKRIFSITTLGGQQLYSVHSIRNRFWDRINSNVYMHWSK